MFIRYKYYIYRILNLSINIFKQCDNKQQIKSVICIIVVVYNFCNHLGKLGKIGWIHENGNGIFL